MAYLIDGYNLLYAMGVLRGRVGPAGLLKARLRLLGLLAAVYRERSGKVTVVFDAAGAPPEGSDRETYEGVEVRYAIKHAQADDLIEELIRHAAAPRQLTVVSDDHRLQRAARQRSCEVLGCGDYLDKLDRLRRAGRQARPAPSEKKERLTERETQDWLKEFGELENDPSLQSPDFYRFDDDTDLA